MANAEAAPRDCFAAAMDLQKKTCDCTRARRSVLGDDWALLKSSDFIFYRSAGAHGNAGEADATHFLFCFHGAQKYNLKFNERCARPRFVELLPGLFLIWANPALSTGDYDDLVARLQRDCDRVRFECWHESERPAHMFSGQSLAVKVKNVLNECVNELPHGTLGVLELVPGSPHSDMLYTVSCRCIMKERISARCLFSDASRLKPEQTDELVALAQRALQQLTPENTAQVEAELYAAATDQLKKLPLLLPHSSNFTSFEVLCWTGSWYKKFFCFPKK